MKIKTCPQCGSREVALYMGSMTGMQYQCKKCGYIGALVVERETEKKF